jgi:hypothetical protein
MNFTANNMPNSAREAPQLGLNLCVGYLKMRSLSRPIAADHGMTDELVQIWKEVVVA